MAAGPVSERNQDATIYVGGLDEKVVLERHIENHMKIATHIQYHSKAASRF